MLGQALLFELYSEPVNPRTQTTPATDIRRMFGLVVESSDSTLYHCLLKYEINRKECHLLCNRVINENDTTTTNRQSDIKMRTCIRAKKWLHCLMRKQFTLQWKVVYKWSPYFWCKWVANTNTRMVIITAQVPLACMRERRELYFLLVRYINYLSGCILMLFQWVNRFLNWKLC